MKWEVFGTKDGRQGHWRVESPTKESAALKAMNGGVEVSDVCPAGSAAPSRPAPVQAPEPEPEPAPVAVAEADPAAWDYADEAAANLSARRVPPDYVSLLDAASIVTFIAWVLFFGGVIVLLGLIALTLLAQSIGYESHFQGIAGIVGAIIVSLPFFGLAALLRLSSTVALAVRDIARNTFHYP
jgi:hypothetical protein